MPDDDLDHLIGYTVFHDGGASQPALPFDTNAGLGTGATPPPTMVLALPLPPAPAAVPQMALDAAAQQPAGRGWPGVAPPPDLGPIAPTASSAVSAWGGAVPVGREESARRTASAPVRTLIWTSAESAAMVELALRDVLEDDEDDDGNVEDIEDGDGDGDDDDIEETGSIDARADDLDAPRVYARAMEALRVSRTVSEVLPGGRRSAGSAELPPLLLPAGRLVMEIDPVSRLRFLHAAVSLEEPSSAKHQATLARVQRFLESPALHGSRARLSTLRADLLEIAREPVELDDEARTTLVGEASFARLDVLGAVHVRARILVGSDGVPIYLAPAAAAALPRLPEIDVEVLAERHSRQEQHDPSRYALRTPTLAFVDHG